MALAAIRLVRPVIDFVLVTGHAELALPWHPASEGKAGVTSRGGAPDVHLHGVGRGGSRDVARTALAPNLVVLRVALVAVHAFRAEGQARRVAGGAVLRAVVRVVEG